MRSRLSSTTRRRRIALNTSDTPAPWCVFRPLLEAIPREVLGRSPALHNLFRKPGVPRGKRGLNHEELTAIVAAMRPQLVPPLVAMLAEPCARPPGEGWFRADAEWGLESEMRDSVLSSGQWRWLFESEPRAESRSADGFQRYDLINYDDQIVAGFKLDANPATLKQIDRYLESLRASEGIGWTGYIVWGNSCSRTLVEQVSICTGGFADLPSRLG